MVMWSVVDVISAFFFSAPECRSPYYALEEFGSWHNYHGNTSDYLLLRWQLLISCYCDAFFVGFVNCYCLFHPWNSQANNWFRMLFRIFWSFFVLLCNSAKMSYSWSQQCMFAQVIDRWLNNNHRLPNAPHNVYNMWIDVEPFTYRIRQ